MDYNPFSIENLRVIDLGCGSGDFLVIEKLQLEGEKEMSSEELLRSHLDFIGTILK